VQTLRVRGTAAEAVAGSLVDGGIAVHGDGSVTAWVGWGHLFRDGNTESAEMNSRSFLLTVACGEAI
jgi:hypothetical protein